VVKPVRQLLTPPLNDLILPGVTRLSLLELVRQWGQWNVVESTISIGQLLEAHLENRVRSISLRFAPISQRHLSAFVLSIIFNL
jgi:D-alanine transaminase